MNSGKIDKTYRINYLNKIFILFDYLFLGIIVGNIGTIFMGAFNLQDNILKILGIFLVWFIIPLIGLIRISARLKNKIIESNCWRFIVSKGIFILNIIMLLFILLCVAINIQNTVIDPKNQITLLKWIHSIF